MKCLANNVIYVFAQFATVTAGVGIYLYFHKGKQVYQALARCGPFPPGLLRSPWDAL